MNFNPQSYGPAVARLLEGAMCNELGPGTPVDSRRAALEALAPESLVEPHDLENRQMALACVAGLWLRHDFLERSHQISQAIKCPAGSYWHGIMHRREPDFANARYWFRRVGEHPIFAALACESARLAGEADADGQAAYLSNRSSWDPFKFVDLCQHALDSPPLRALCASIQQREWELLFDDCYRKAIG